MASLFRSFGRRASRAPTDSSERTEPPVTPNGDSGDSMRRFVFSPPPPSPTPRPSSSSTITPSIAYSGNSGQRNNANKRRSFFGGTKFTFPSLSRHKTTNSTSSTASTLATPRPSSSTLGRAPRISIAADPSDLPPFEPVHRHRHSIAVFRSRTPSYSPAPSPSGTPTRLPRRPASNVFSGFASPIASAISSVTRRSSRSFSPAPNTPAPPSPMIIASTLPRPSQQINRESRRSLVAQPDFNVHAGAGASSSTLHPSSAGNMSSSSQRPVSWHVGAASFLFPSAKAAPAVAASAAEPPAHPTISISRSPTPTTPTGPILRPSFFPSGRRVSVAWSEGTPSSASTPGSPASQEADESSVFETDDEPSTSDSEVELAQVPGWLAPGGWRAGVWQAAGMGNGGGAPGAHPSHGNHDQTNKQNGAVNGNGGTWESAWRNAEAGFVNPFGTNTPTIVHAPVYIGPSYTAGPASVIPETLPDTHLNASGRPAPPLTRMRSTIDSPTPSTLDPPPPRPPSAPLRRRVPDPICPPSSTSPPPPLPTSGAPSSTPPVQLSAPAQPAPSTRSTTPNPISPTSTSSYATTDARSSMYHSSSPTSSSATAGRESRYAGDLDTDLDVDSDAGWGALVMRELEVAGKAGAKKGANTHVDKASHGGRRNSQGFWRGHARVGSGSWGGQVLREMGF
ncbi:hypothetical protein M427DRAFT_154362 [Gonapodya prolifera JEL478]|uniref:Uncharacterized protein n=1 Tax=Gonapodya prolifera (strain JEL478) TaxID=1344416 RepID=A0A139AIV1_GONPJ|nr:hypothetical protein M427DRAFT_154362 [Gonapodya prolifera JEL478]|eukprot:KXS16383.1 hypothetical protein M427DRAFT_154362 [Gonapodya prolifera JEL478]